MPSDLPWCVRHKHGWCVLKPARRAEPKYRDNEETQCDHYITFPFGYAQREPTCRECVEAMRKRAKGKR